MTRSYWTFIVGLSLSYAAISSPVGAQPGTIQGPTLDVRRPALEVPEARDPDVFELPDLTQQPGRLGASNGTRFTLDRIDVAGVTILEMALIGGITSRYTGRSITQADLIQLRNELTALYVSQGYISSGALIPDQDVSDGVLDVRIVEGRLDGVVVSGNTYLTDTYISDRLGVDGSILNASDLQRDFQLLLEDRNVRRMDARLVPGSQLGSANIEVEIEEERRWDLAAFLGSDRAPSVGGVRGGFAGAYRTLFTPGDELSGEVGITEGLVDGRADYVFPIGTSRWSGRIFGSSADAEIQDEPLSSLGAESRSWSFGAGVTYPIIAEPGKSLIIQGSIDATHVETELFGIPFDFSPGSVNGETDYTTIRISPLYNSFTNRRALSLGASLAVGIDGEEALISAAVIPEPQYWHLSADVVYVRLMSNAGRQIILRGSGRYSEESLYSTEKFAVGGLGSVRGYRKNALLGDRGLFASAEYQVPASELFNVGEGGLFDPARFVFGLFVDAATVDNADQLDPITDSISSAGLTVAWEINDNATLSAYWGHAFEDLPFSDDFQDDGFGFQLVARF